MSRRLLPLLALLLVLVPGALIASGCGAEDAAGVDVAKAASATGAKGTAAVDLDVRASGFGLPGSLRLEGNGVTDLDEPKLDISFDVAKLASTLGMPLDDGEVRIKVDGAKVYAKPPAIPGFELPDGATWVALDLQQAAKAMGIDVAGFGKLMSLDPASHLRALRQAKGLKEVGKEDVAGAETTHLRGTLTIRDLLAGLPAAQREEAEKAIKQLEGFTEVQDDPMPVELWVDDEGVVRRMVQGSKVPGEKGVPGGEIKVTYELSDFGKELDVSAPAKGDTFDATEALSGLLKQGAAFGLGGGQPID